MHKFKIACICSIALFASSYAPASAIGQNETALATQASDAAAQQPKPGPEVEKLSYYVGTWKGEGETKGGPFGPAGKLSSSISCEKFAGSFQVVCRGEERGPTGKRTFLNILAYDEKAKAYTEYGISSFGESEYSTGGFHRRKQTDLRKRFRYRRGREAYQDQVHRGAGVADIVHIQGRGIEGRSGMDADRRGQDYESRLALGRNG